MRLAHLSLGSFRGFDALELPFPEQGPTVLIGKNGAGKSTVLCAIEISLRRFADLALRSQRSAHRNALMRLAPEDVRSGATRAHASALFDVGGRRFAGQATWGANGRVETAMPWAPSLDELVSDELVPGLEGGPHVEVPVLASYRPNRGVDIDVGGKNRKAKPPAHPQLAAYLHAFGSQVGPFGEMLRWFRAMEDQENQERLRRSPTYRNPRLQAVRQAIERFMSALTPDTFHNLRVVRHLEEGTAGAASPWAVSDTATFLLDKGTVSLPLDALSDGERGALLLVADLAMRLVITHPGAADPLHGAGIVLIDEIEMHLHPGWQRRILPGLSAVFPNLQIIATTHSPQVLSTLPAEAIVMLEDFRRVEPIPPSYGRDTNSILREHMGTSARPEEHARKLVQIHELIDQERYLDAAAALDEIAEQLGELDPEIVRLRTLAHFVED